jgi:hypothetical protein
MCEDLNQNEKWWEKDDANIQTSKALAHSYV